MMIFNALRSALRNVHFVYKNLLRHRISSVLFSWIGLSIRIISYVYAMVVCLFSVPIYLSISISKYANLDWIWVFNYIIGSNVFFFILVQIADAMGFFFDSINELISCGSIIISHMRKLTFEVACSNFDHDLFLFCHDTSFMN